MNTPITTLTDHARYTARRAQITAGARPTAVCAARRIHAWVDAMDGRIAYTLGVHQGRPVCVAVADARALADHTATAAQRDELRAAVTAYLTHADGEPRTLAPSRGTRPPLFTYDVLVLLDQQDGVTCPNGNRPPECTEIDPCEACAQDADAEGEMIEASMGLRDRPADADGRGSTDVYEVTVVRTQRITFRLPAASVQDAEERYLTDGEQGSSNTVQQRVESTRRVDPDAG
ncbi:hypothetical protein [Streptomyces sp. NBC_00557]|uniref:hypothetical protein n=1 Tax=Streptomyces sp. NBC_00557 TaxID=2975776 RepID=UPI002E8123BF|nr:hypothetical protein [Streptomyces sp. NBC_00557]WUC39668.1 hypothetical protein OG956_38575 [Streptomyces sp. NBC_00557]